MNHQELVVLLKDCYETADFNPILPFLSPEVKRVSMWYEDIIGIDAFVKYLELKARMRRKYPLSRLHLAKLTSLHHQPTCSDFEHNPVYTVSQISGYKFRKDTRLTLSYPENELVILTQEDIYTDLDVVIRIELDDKGLIHCLSLSDVHLYAYTLIDEHSYTDVQLGQFAVDFIEEHFRKLGYATHAFPYNLDDFPHLNVQKQDTQYQVVVFTDRYPFSGGIHKDIERFLAMRSFLAKHPLKLINVQVESLGKHKHQFKLEDPIQYHILSFKDAYIPYTGKEKLTIINQEEKQRNFEKMI